MVLMLFQALQAYSLLEVCECLLKGRVTTQWCATLLFKYFLFLNDVSYGI